MASNPLPPTEAESRQAIQAQVLADEEAIINQLKQENIRIDRTVERTRLLPQVITGERVLRSRLTYDDGISLILSRRERRNNQVFLAKYNTPLDGVGGVGNQQPLPFEVNIPADNSLLDLQRNTDTLRYGGATYDSGAFVKKCIYPSRKMLTLYEADMIRETPISQAWIPLNVSAVGPGGRFIFKRTNDVDPPFVKRASLDNRLLFQTFVDGKWT